VNDAARAVGSRPVPAEAGAAAERHTTATTLLLAAIVGAVALLLAGLLTPPAHVPFLGHGESFAQQAANPWSLVGKFPQRILWPVLAWCAAQVGIGGAAFSQVCSGALLATVFWFCRVRGAAFVDALLVTAAIAATGAVQLYQVMTCHSDSLVWILLLLLVHHVRRGRLFWGLVFVAALSHEMVFFLSPWLVWLRRANGANVRRELVALFATGGAYAAWLAVVKVFGQSQGLGVLYYLQENWLVLGTLGLWCVWGLLLLCEFGPLLAVVVWGWRTDRLGMGGRHGPLVYALCVLSTMAFAYDVQRFSCFAFLPLVLGAIAFLDAPRRRVIFVVLLLASLGSYAWFHLIPPEGVDALASQAKAGGWPYDRVWHYVLEFGSHAPGTRGRFFTHVIPHLWLETLLFTAFAAAIVGLGLWLARDQREPRTMRNASP